MCGEGRMSRADRVAVGVVAVVVLIAAVILVIVVRPWDRGGQSVPAAGGTVHTR
jgi:hypothetical protein